MPITVEFTLTDAQIDLIVERLAAAMGKRIDNPLTVAAFAREIKKSWPTVKKWVDAGVITKLPIPGQTRIPYSELERFRAGGQPRRRVSTQRVISGDLP